MQKTRLKDFFNRLIFKEDYGQLFSTVYYDDKLGILRIIFDNDEEFQASASSISLNRRQKQNIKKLI